MGRLAKSSFKDKGIDVPKTQIGKISIGEFFTFVLCLSVFFLVAASGEKGGDTYFSNLKLAIPMTMAIIFDAAAFVTGIVSVFKLKERALIVYLIIGISFFPLIFVMAEFITPH